MEYRRRSIPSVPSLIAFEATARHLSFSRAAVDLSLTQGAVSKRVRQLELVLGYQLLARNTNQVCLTEIGRSYLSHARKLLRQLQLSTEDIRASAKGRDSIRVAAPNAFAARWLVPQLMGFTRLFPGWSINLLSFASADDPRLADVDCVIFDGRSPWRDAQTIPLASSPDIIVASPGYLREMRPSTAEQLAQMQLLRDNRRPELWPQWFAAAGCDEPIVESACFDEQTVLIEAATLGQGVAILPELLVAEDVRASRLQRLFLSPAPAQTQYHLAVRQQNSNRNAAETFVKWVTSAQKSRGGKAREPLPGGDEIIPESHAKGVYAPPPMAGTYS